MIRAYVLGTGAGHEGLRRIAAQLQGAKATHAVPQARRSLGGAARAHHTTPLTRATIRRLIMQNPMSMLHMAVSIPSINSSSYT